MQHTSEPFLQSTVYSLPLRREMKAILHFLLPRKHVLRLGLDIGFTNADASQTLRKIGGYWMTVEPTEARVRRVSDELGEETVLAMGKNGELPFEDKQFDVVVVANHIIPVNPAAALEFIRECHRVIKPSGHLVFTVCRHSHNNIAPASGKDFMGAGFSESSVFNLLRDGFDVPGIRCSCRFFVRQVQRWIEQRRETYGMTSAIARIAYGIAQFLDYFVIFGKGHQMTVFAHRKGWREKRNSLLGGTANYSNAILTDPRRAGKISSVMKFK